MSKLGKAAAIATIVGAILTAATFFNISDEPVETGTPSASNTIGEEKTDPIVRERNGLGSSTTTESRPDVGEAEIRTRFDAARKIPITSSRSSALQRLATTASDLGFFSTAFRIASEVPFTSTRSATLSYVAKKAAKAGEARVMRPAAMSKAPKAGEAIHRARSSRSTSRLTASSTACAWPCPMTRSGVRFPASSRTPWR